MLLLTVVSSCKVFAISVSNGCQLMLSPSRKLLVVVFFHYPCWCSVWASAINQYK